MRQLSQICQTELHVTRLTQIPRIKGFGHRNKAARIVSFIYLFLTLLGYRNISRSLISSIAERKQ